MTYEYCQKNQLVGSYSKHNYSRLSAGISKYIPTKYNLSIPKKQKQAASTKKKALIIT